MLAEYLPGLLLAWGVQIMGVVSPGPGVALIIGVALADGRRPAMLTTLGISSATIVLATATVLGFAALLASMQTAMTFVRVAGGLYLLWLAYKAFGRAMRPPPITPINAAGGSTWLRGFLLQISNPKAIFFWLAVAALGSLEGAPVPILVLFVAGAFLNSFLGHGAYGFILSSASARARFLAWRRWIEGALGAVFGLAGLRLLMARS